MTETKKAYYAIIPANVRYDKRLTPNAKLLYGEITALCNEKGFCWASNDYFASLYEVSKGTVSSWISKLVKLEYISLQLIYKEGSKEIEHRYIKLSVYPMVENVYTPIPKIMQDNTTSYNNTNNNTYKKVANEQFDTFYTLYPKKTNKTDSRSTFEKLIKKGVTLEYILSKLKIYESTIKREKTESQFIRNPQRFLNTLDDYEEIETTPKKLVTVKSCSCGGDIVNSRCKDCGQIFDAKGEMI